MAIIRGFRVNNTFCRIDTERENDRLIWDRCIFARSSRFTATAARHVLYSNTDIMSVGLDRCSSVMRLRLMIRDRIFLWIN